MTALSGTLAAGAVAIAAGGSRLVMNGKVVSNEVRVINGSSYVKLSDVAKALGMTVVKTSGGFELKKEGGATPIAGVAQGKIGQKLFDGKWRFNVVRVETPESYTMTTGADLYDFTGLSSFDRRSHLVRPRAGNTPVLVHCHVTNGQNEVRTLWTAINDEKVHTALTDTNGSSYPPIGYDFEGGPTQTKRLVFGASVDFPVIFSVPQNTRLKDLIFTLRNNDPFAPGSDVRVSLDDASTSGASSGAP